MPWMCWRSPRAHLSEPMAQVKSFLCPCSGQPRWLRPAAAAYPTSDSTKAGSRHPQKSNTRAVTHTHPPPNSTSLLVLRRSNISLRCQCFPAAGAKLAESCFVGRCSAPRAVLAAFLQTPLPFP